MKTLIAEDELAYSQILQQILSRYGTCETVSNGTEALEAFHAAARSNNRYDLICLDIMMPGMNGHQVLKEIRKHEEADGIGGFDAVKVIMITALDDPKNIIESFKGQCEAYLVKPFSQQTLIQKLRDMKLIAGS